MKGICECDSLGFNLVYRIWPEGKSLTVGKAGKLVKSSKFIPSFTFSKVIQNAVLFDTPVVGSLDYKYSAWR